MSELSQEAIEQIKLAVREAMSDKIEITFGVDCRDPTERDELREDMKFLRAMKNTAQTGGQKVFWGLLGLVGTGIGALFWPELQRWLRGN